MFSVTERTIWLDGDNPRPAILTPLGVSQVKEKANFVCGTIAQRSEQQTHNLLVLGSNPSGPTNFLERKSLMLVKLNTGETVECFPALNPGAVSRFDKNFVVVKIRETYQLVESWGNILKCERGAKILQEHFDKNCKAYKIRHVYYWGSVVSS